jgi:hypothetical protein
MILVIDQKGILWKIDKWNHYVVHHGSAPLDATVIQGDFDGFKASAKQFDDLFGRYTMRVASQTTTYELTMTELTSLLAKELNVSESKITIQFKTRPVDNEPAEIYGLDVVVSDQHK